MTPAGSGLPFGTGIALSGRLQAGLRFIRHPLPPGPSPFLAVGIPSKMGTVGFTQLIEIETCRGEVGLYSPVKHAGAAAGRDSSSGPFHVAFWLRPVSLFGRFGVTSPVSLHLRSTFHVSPSRVPP